MTPAQTATYREALTTARKAYEHSTNRLAALTAEIESLQGEISRLRRTIAALAAMCSEAPSIDSLGITEACMEVMETAVTAMTTADVVNALDGMGFDIKGQKNANASVHTVLNRLAGRQRITKVLKDGMATWKGPKFDANAGHDDDIPF